MDGWMDGWMDEGMMDGPPKRGIYLQRLRRMPPTPNRNPEQTVGGGALRCDSGAGNDPFRRMQAKCFEV